MSCCLQVEFNKAALSLSDALPGDKKAAMNRLLKVCLYCSLPGTMPLMPVRTS